MVALHKATLSLFSDLSLDGVLQRVIQAARELADASTPLWVSLMVMGVWKPF